MDPKANVARLVVPSSTYRAIRTMPDNKLTASSLLYRMRASELARLSNAERDQVEQLKLIQQALSWISLAENEEIIELTRQSSNAGDWTN